MNRLKTPLKLASILILCSILPLAASEGTKPTNNIVVPTLSDVKAPSSYMFTDKVIYRTGEKVTLKLHQSANGNPAPYCSYFVYFEDLQTGQKTYVHSTGTSATPVDIFNNAANATTGRYPIYLIPELRDFVILGTDGLLGAAPTVPATAGTYRYVMELRDGTGTVIQSQAYAPFTVVEGVDTLSGNITADRTLSNKRAYLLSGIVIVKTGATLTIEPGTILFGETATLGGLCVEQGAKIRAIGTAQRPIVFTSASPVGSRKSADWFGIAIAGKAPINISGGTSSVEGIETVKYGGTDPNDDSGIMRYVRIEYAGIRFTPTREANGLYLCGVGAGTTLEYLHFNNNGDDNIEFFGGTAQARFIYCTGGEDDQLDWTEGFSGKLQFVIVQVYPNTGANRGIEADNLDTNHDATPRSSPKIYNMTIVGPRQNWGEAEGQADHGLMLRRGTAGELRNFIVMGYGRDGINMIDTATIAQTNSGALSFDNAIFHENGVWGADGIGTFGNANTKTWIDAKSTNILQTDPKLVDPYNRLTPDYTPGVGSPATRIGIAKNPPDDGFFTRVNFIGGMGSGYNWLEGGWAYISEK